MNKKELKDPIEEVWALFKETDKRFKETDERLDKRFEKTDERFKQDFEEVAERFKETDKEIKKLTKNIGGLSGKWGKFVEGLVAPGTIRMFKERGIEVKETYTRADSIRNGKRMEIDVLAVNEEYVVAIEVKSTLTVEAVNEYLKDLQRFKQFFPHFKDRKIIGAVAGIVIDENADRYAYHKGLFVIGQTGETVNILNDEKFEPKVW